MNKPIRLSIIISVFNEEAVLEKLLSAVNRNTTFWPIKIQHFARVKLEIKSLILILKNPFPVFKPVTVSSKVKQLAFVH